MNPVRAAMLVIQGVQPMQWQYLSKLLRPGVDLKYVLEHHTHILYTFNSSLQCLWKPLVTRFWKLLWPKYDIINWHSNAHSCSFSHSINIHCTTHINFHMRDLNVLPRWPVVTCDLYTLGGFRSGRRTCSPRSWRKRWRRSESTSWFTASRTCPPHCRPAWSSAPSASTPFT